MSQKKCLFCGKDFNVPKCRDDKAKFCSTLCKYEHKKKIGITYVERICQRCGKVFKVEPRYKGKFCSQECYHLTKRRRIYKNCLNCNKEFEIKQSVYMNCCSMKCRLEFQKKNKIDRSFYRSSEWKRIRMRVLVRDDFKCCNCADDLTELHVHHVVEVKKGGNDSVDNLITLCVKCHENVHRKIRL